MSVVCAEELDDMTFVETNGIGQMRSFESREEEVWYCDAYHVYVGVGV